MKPALFYISLACIVFFTACSKEIIEPELYGSIEGTVINAINEEGVHSVSIETSPATEVILTANNGRFKLTNVPTGKYVIKAHKLRYGTKSVNISVRENEVSSAKIVLEPKGENPGVYLQAGVTSWHQTGTADSAFVEVEYRFRNTSESTTLNQFEVYFDIHNNQETFFFEVADTTLKPRETNFGSFRKYIRDSVVDSVVVSGTWVSG